MEVIEKPINFFGQKYTPINVGIKNFIKWFKDYYKF